MKQFLNKEFLGGCAVLLLVCLAYTTSVRNSFVYDDFDYVVGNRLVATPGAGLGEIFTTPYPPHHPEQNLYRPLVTLTFVFDRMLWGLPADPLNDPTPFHVSNLLMHLAVVWLLYGFLLRLPPVAGSSSRIGVAAVCACLYGVHPITTEAVAWVSGRAEILCAFFCLLSLRFLVRGIELGQKGFVWVFAAWVAFLAALFSKENALALPLIAIILMIWLSRGGRMEWNKIWIAPAGFFLLAFLYYSSRTRIFGGVPMEQAFTGLTDPATRMLVGCKVLLRYLWLTLFPYGQSIFHEVEMERLLGGFALAVLVALFATAWFLRRRAPWILFGLAFFYAALLPVSNLLIPIGAVMAERFLYFPLVGLILALGFGLAGHRPRLPALWIMVLAVVILHHGVKTFVRNADWKNNSTLWAAAMRVYPGSFIVQAQYGFASADRGQFADAWRAFDHAEKLLATQPEIFREKFGPRIADKKREVWGILSTRPDDPALEAIHDIARSGKLREATVLYAAYLDAHPGSVAAHQAMIDCLMRLGAFKEAAFELRKLLRVTPDNGLLYGKLGFCHAQMSQFALARVNYRRALELNPADTVSLANLGILETRAGRYVEALPHFRKAVELQPQNADFLHNLAACELALGDEKNARLTLRKLLALDPEHPGGKKLSNSLKK